MKHITYGHGHYWALWDYENDWYLGVFHWPDYTPAPCQEFKTMLFKTRREARQFVKKHKKHAMPVKVEIVLEVA